MKDMISDEARELSRLIQTSPGLMELLHEALGAQANLTANLTAVKLRVDGRERAEAKDVAETERILQEIYMHAGKYIHTSEGGVVANIVDGANEVLELMRTHERKGGG
jgi:hypothetical protein